MSLGVKLVVGDSVAMMERRPWPLPLIDVTVTSPPYNLGITYGEGVDDSLPRADYLAWTKRWLTALLGITSPQGSLFLNIWGKPASPWGPFEVALVAREAGWHLQNTIFWIKSLTDADGESVGQFKPLNSKRFVNDCGELILHLTPGGDTPIDRLAVGVGFADKSNIKRFGKSDSNRADRRCRGNVWVVPDPLPTTTSDARWLALFVDTEGSISCTRTIRPDRPSPHYSWTVAIYNTNRALIESARAIVGGDIPIYERQPGSGENGGVKGNKLGYVIKVSNKAAASLLARIYPYLIAKKRQAMCALFLNSLVDAGNHRTVPESDLIVRDQVCDSLKLLNGPEGDSVDVSWIPAPMRFPGSNVILAPYETIQSRAGERPHPATFPVSLAERCYRLHGIERTKLTFDPFSGLGSSGVAAKRLGLSHLGIEKIQTNHEFAKARVEKEAAS